MTAHIYIYRDEKVYDFVIDFKSVFFRNVHSWFIRSLFWPSTQCISITTSPSSGITFSRHLNRKSSTAPGLRGRFKGSSLDSEGASFGLDSWSASVDIEDSMSTSSPDALSETSFCPPLGSCEGPPLSDCSLGCCCGPVSPSADVVLSGVLSSWLPSCVGTDWFWGGAPVAKVVWELVRGQWGARGSSRRWREASRLFWRPWIQVFSTAVRKRLCSCLLHGTRLCSTCRTAQHSG